MSQNSPAIRQSGQVATKSPANAVKDLLLSDSAKRQFQMALPKHITVDLLLRITLTAVNKNPKLAECTQESLFGSIMDLAQMGLVPDNRTAYLVPFWNGKKKALDCQYIVGYQGFIELAYRHPLVKGIRFATVFEKDYFEYEDGLESKLIHKPTDEEDPGRPTHAWAVCEMEGGGRTFVVINARAVAKSMKMSKDSDKPWSPWQEHTEAMWQKTAVRALAKRMPRSAELIAAIEADDNQAKSMAIDTMATVAAGAIGDSARNAIEEASASREQNEEHPLGNLGNAVETAEEQKPSHAGPSIDDLRAEVTTKLGAIRVARSKLITQLVADKIIPSAVPFGDIPQETLQSVIDGWDDFKEKLTTSN